MVDAKGNEIAVGDKVLVLMTITRVSPGRNTVYLESVSKDTDGHHDHATMSAASVIKG